MHGTVPFPTPGADRRRPQSGAGGRTARRVGAGTTALAVLLLWTVPAGAGTTGSDGPGGTVSVGAGSGTGGDGSPGQGPGSGGPPPAAPWTCVSTYLTLNNEGGAPPGGPQPGAWYSVTCIDRSTGAQTTQTLWLTSAAPPPTPPVDPHQLALRAERSMVLPAPTVRTDPAGTTLVNLATWLWVAPSVWRSQSVTATAGTVSATAVARPAAVAWATGDGSEAVCAGPGTPYDPGRPAVAQSTTCSHVYLRSSAGQPAPDGRPDQGAFRVTASIVWAVSWTAQGAPGGGRLPDLVTSASTPLRVAQVESVNAVPLSWPGGRPALEAVR